MLLSGFQLLDGDHPADPFIARERRNIFPLCARGGIGDEGFSQIGREVMDHAGGELFGHAVTLNRLRSDLIPQGLKPRLIYGS